MSSYSLSLYFRTTDETRFCGDIRFLSSVRFRKYTAGTSRIDRVEVVMLLMLGCIIFNVTMSSYSASLYFADETRFCRGIRFLSSVRFRENAKG